MHMCTYMYLLTLYHAARFRGQWDSQAARFQVNTVDTFDYQDLKAEE